MMLTIVMNTVGGSVEGLYRCGSHGELHEPGDAAHNHLHYPPVVHDGDYRTEDHHN